MFDLGAVERLRELAAATEPGTWFSGRRKWAPDRDFIKAASPDVVLALLDALAEAQSNVKLLTLDTEILTVRAEAAEKERDELKAKLARSLDYIGGSPSEPQRFGSAVERLRAGYTKTDDVRTVLRDVDKLDRLRREAWDAKDAAEAERDDWRKRAEHAANIFDMADKGRLAAEAERDAWKLTAVCAIADAEQQHLHWDAAEAKLARIAELHHTSKIWETDRSYTLFCAECLNQSPPCATTRILNDEGTE